MVTNPSRRTVATCTNCERPIERLYGDWVHSEGYATWCRPPQVAEPKQGTERSVDPQVVPAVPVDDEGDLAGWVAAAFNLIPPVRPTVQGGHLDMGAGSDRLD